MLERYCSFIEIGLQEYKLMKRSFESLAIIEDPLENDDDE